MVDAGGFFYSSILEDQRHVRPGDETQRREYAAGRNIKFPRLTSEGLENTPRRVVYGADRCGPFGECTSRINH